MEVRSCKQCGGVFHTKQSLIARGYGVYCSRACHHAGMRTAVLGVCTTCGAGVRRTPAKLRINKSKKVFCGKSCQTKWRNTQYRGKNHTQWKGGNSVNYRAIMKKASVPEVCALCHTVDTRVLAVHHIDRNRINNALENLLWLCHNCHHLTHYTKGGVRTVEVPVGHGI